MTNRILRLTILAAAAALPFAVPMACSSSSDNLAGTTESASGQPTSGSASGGAGTSSGGAGGGATSVGGATAAGGSGGFSIAPCQGHVYQCGDTIDNDMDGLIDSSDPECLGPCDNTEDSLFGGIPGQQNAPCKADCYWDQDTGPGNDDCYWSHECDTHEVPPAYYPEPNKGTACAFDPNANIPGTSKTCSELAMAQSQDCLDYCGPLTPNGCDCFGCCEIPDESGNWVYVGSEGVDSQNPTVCQLMSVMDPTLCHPCDPVPACLNDCGHCELCIGKTMLPADCFPDGGGGNSGAGGGGNNMQCPPAIPPIQACGLPGQMPCPPGWYCITGCCYELPN